MAKGLQIKIERRPCSVSVVSASAKTGRKRVHGLFYGFELAKGKAVVELENGELDHFDPKMVELLDSKQEFRQWYFGLL